MFVFTWFWILSLFVCAIRCEINPYLSVLQSHPWKSVQNYLEVRPGAFMFYWFYYADGTSFEAASKPLLIWVQGGPGLAASGLANFAEIGPFTMDLKPRNHTWVRGRNLLLFDHPVGTGFSYVTNKTLLVKSDREAATDLAIGIKMFYRRHREFKKTPTYLIGQSYGGKLLPRLAYYLHSAIDKSLLKMNFKGLGIGSGWVDPKESTLIQPGFLYNMGVIDQQTYLTTLRIAKQMSHRINKKDYKLASSLDTLLFHTLMKGAAGMELNFNNINQKSPYPALHKLSETINMYVKPTLHMVNQSLSWYYVSEAVFESLNSSFIVPSLKFLEMLLNKTGLKIAVYNGNLDIVTPLAGASNWVHKLKWHGAEEFRNTKRTLIRGTGNGFYKTTKQFSFWWVFGAGHWVPEDNPEAMDHILDFLTTS